MLVVAALLAIGAHYLLQLRPMITAGLYAGSLTNTPALAGILDYVSEAASPELREAMLAEPVIGYSIAYPTGVLGMILTITVLQRL